jgi:uncharacterized membrane protein
MIQIPESTLQWLAGGAASFLVVFGTLLWKFGAMVGQLRRDIDVIDIQLKLHGPAFDRIAAIPVLVSDLEQVKDTVRTLSRSMMNVKRRIEYTSSHDLIQVMKDEEDDGE